MTDDMTATGQMSLAASLRSRRPAQLPRHPVARTEPVEPAAPVPDVLETATPVEAEIQPFVAAPVEVEVQPLVAAPVETIPEKRASIKRPNPITPEVDQRVFDKAWLEGVKADLIAQVSQVVSGQLETLSKEAKTAERAQIRLDDSIGRTVKLNPERMALLEGERARAVTELHATMAELDRTRRALKMVTGGGMKAFWRRLGEDLSGLSEECADLIDAAPTLAQGQVSPELGRRIYAFLRSMGHTTEAYADNCLAYAEDVE